ncbi:MAG: radical SAM protein [Bacteroidetes bacterium]|nr:MAG: radical SAM protein [Bacteroidota bacterium]
MIKEVKAKTVIHKHDRAFPVMLDLNPYRGCTIGCKYCFAQYSHYYIGLEDFFKDIIVKTNVAQCLDLELHKKKKRRGQVKIGGVTDAYQHLEKKYLLMPKILKVFQKYKVPIFLSTKSDLILRDFESIKQLAAIAPVDIAVSISSINEKTAKILEPGAPSPIKRMEALAKFSGICRSVSVLNMPVIPYISDSYEELDELFALAKKLKVDNLVSYPLHLRNQKVKDGFFVLTKKYFPQNADRFIEMYRSSATPDK